MLNDLGQLAQVVMALIGLAAILGPFLNRLDRLRSLQFGEGPLFSFLAELGTVCTLIAIYYYRNSLHFWPTYALLMIGAFVAFLVCRWMAGVYEANRKDWLVPIGGGIYVIAICLGFAGLTIVAAYGAVFYQLGGDVVGDRGGTRVFISFQENTDTLVSETDSSGYFQFLLTQGEFQSITNLQIPASEEFLEFDYRFTDEDRCESISSPSRCRIPPIQRDARESREAVK